MARRAAVWVRWLVAVEELPVAPDPDPGETPSAPHFLAWLLTREGLMQSLGGMGPPVRRPGFVRRVFAPELLSDLGAEHRAASEDALASGSGSDEDARFAGPHGGSRKQEKPRRTLVYWLLSGEECPRDAPPPPGRREGFVRQMLASEDLSSVEKRVQERQRGLAG